MQATRIIAVRHGETAWNVSTRIQGQLDIPLNDNGRWQAQRLARALAASEQIAAIYASDLLRAWDTAQSIANAAGLQTITEPGLRGDAATPPPPPPAATHTCAMPQSFAMRRTRLGSRDSACSCPQPAQLQGSCPSRQGPSPPSPRRA